jgi:hypothetical protein
MSEELFEGGIRRMESISHFAAAVRFVSALDHNWQMLGRSAQDARAGDFPLR